MQIRINGQLMLLMLAENLVEIGCRIIQANTDGLFVLLDRNIYNKVNEVCKNWEKLTRLELEEDRFEAMYQFAINDYLAIKEGYSETKNPKLIKTKGLFIDKVNLGKGMAPTIIPEAINKYFADGIPIEETITKCQDINKFITYQKVSKEYSVEYNDEIIQHINRYYVSTNGPWLYKCKIKSKDEYEPAVKVKKGVGENEELIPCYELEYGGKYYGNPNIKVIENNLKILYKKGERTNYIKLLTDSGVTIINNLDNIKTLPDNINYRFYIAAASKIITQFENKQLTLF